MLPDFALNPGRRERNFWMQRHGTKNRRSNARALSRDQNPRNEWPKIPAETPYLALSPTSAVCEGWVVVCAVICEPVSGKIP